MSEDFVNHIAGYLKSRRQSVDTQAKKALQDESIKKARAPEEWSLLRDWMKGFCEDENRADGSNVFQFRVTQNRILEVCADVPGLGNRTLHVEFNSETSGLSYRTEGGIASGRVVPPNPKSSGTFTPVVDGTEFFFSDGSDRITAVKMGQAMVNALLNIPQ